MFQPKIFPKSTKFSPGVPAVPAGFRDSGKIVGTQVRLLRKSLPRTLGLRFPMCGVLGKDLQFLLCTFAAGVFSNCRVTPGYSRLGIHHFPTVAAKWKVSWIYVNICLGRAGETKQIHKVSRLPPPPRQRSLPPKSDPSCRANVQQKLKTCTIGMFAVSQVQCFLKLCLTFGWDIHIVK